MFPWKMFFRSFSALVLFLTGGFAAGHELPLPMPFETNPTEAAAPAAPTVDETTTTTAAPVDETTTTTTTIASDTLPVVEPVPAPEPTATPEPTSPAQPVKPAPPVAAPAPAPAPDAPPAAPVDPDAPSVCAAAATRACGTAPTADNSHDARVQRCEAWWTSLAQALNDNGRPDWAARATKIASHCDAMITRWEQMEQRWRERQDKKGDHNNDRRPDNGWHKRGEPDRHREGR